MNISKKFVWKTTEQVTVTKSFSWSTGNNPLYWYRVEGECRPLTEKDCTVTGLNTNNNCGGNSSFTQVVAAKNLTDLCQKLKSGILTAPTTWPLKSIKKYSRPVYTDSGAPSGPCNELTEQEFCQLKECSSFCLYLSATTTAGARAYYKPIIRVEGLGGFSLTGSAVANGDNPIGSGGFTLSGSADVTCGSFSYQATGGFTLGDGIPPPSLSFYSYTATGAMTLTGSASVGSSKLNYTPNSGFSLTGQALMTPAFRYVPVLTLLTLAGSAAASETADYSVEGSGGMALDGAGSYTADRAYIATGSMALGGAAVVTSPRFTYVATGAPTLTGQAGVGISVAATGGFVLSGGASATPIIRRIGQGGLSLTGEAGTSGNRVYVGSGGFTLSGAAQQNTQEFSTTAGANATLMQISVDFFDVPGAPLSVTPITIINNCNCPPLPSTLILNQNLASAGQLAAFISRNKITTLTPDITLTYNSVSASWQRIFHLRGRGQDGKTIENWNIFFEWQCTTTVGDQTLSQSVWKFMGTVTQMIPSKNQRYDTKVLFSFNPATVCINDKLQLKFTLNTNSRRLSTVPPTTVGANILFDEIGLFQSIPWTQNPKLAFNISTKRTQELAREDISSIFSTQPLVFSN